MWNDILYTIMHGSRLGKRACLHDILRMCLCVYV